MKVEDGTEAFSPNCHKKTLEAPESNRWVAGSMRVPPRLRVPMGLLTIGFP